VAAAAALTFGTDGIVITASLAPVHDVGGDAFDYAVNGDSAQFACLRRHGPRSAGRFDSLTSSPAR
jgi:hypothetical protein